MPQCGTSDETPVHSVRQTAVILALNVGFEGGEVGACLIGLPEGEALLAIVGHAS